jgi:hypothetical protein
MKMRILLVLSLALWAAPASAQYTLGGPVTLTTTAANEAACTVTSCLSVNLVLPTGQVVSNVSVQTSGTCGTCTLQLRETVDGINWVNTQLVPSTSSTAVTTISTAGIWTGSIGAAKTFLLRMSALSTGSFTVSIIASPGLGINPNASGGGGGVTSVNMTVPTGLSVSGGPITGSGTFAVSLSSTFPGSSIPAINVAASGAGGITGVMTVSNGGSGANSLTGLVLGNGTSPYTTATIGSGLSLIGGTLSASGGGGGSPCGSTTDIQINTSGGFGCDTGVFTYSTSAHTLNLGEYLSGLPINGIIVSPAGANNTGGTAGGGGVELALNPGNGGTSTGGAVNFGGTGGPIQLFAGNGGNASGGSIVSIGGTGGTVTIAAGAGGAGTSANASSGSIAFRIQGLSFNTVFSIDGNGTLETTSGNTATPTGGTYLAVVSTSGTTCGTSPTIAGNPNSWEVTVGATLAGTPSCTITFPSNVAGEWVCMANDSTTATPIQMAPNAINKTIIQGLFTSGDKIQGLCLPR